MCRVIKRQFHITSFAVKTGFLLLPVSPMLNSKPQPTSLLWGLKSILTVFVYMAELCFHSINVRTYLCSPHYSTTLSEKSSQNKIHSFRFTSKVNYILSLGSSVWGGQIWVKLNILVLFVHSKVLQNHSGATFKQISKIAQNRLENRSNS